MSLFHSESTTIIGLKGLALRLDLFWGFLLILLCLSVVYVVGFEQMVYVHDSFHDIRHAAGFPCH